MSRRQILRFTIAAALVLLLVWHFRASSSSDLLIQESRRAQAQEGDACTLDADCAKKPQNGKTPLSDADDQDGTDLLHKQAQEPLNDLLRQVVASTPPAFPSYAPLPSSPVTLRKFVPSNVHTRTVVLAATITEDISWFLGNGAIPQTVNVSKQYFVMDNPRRDMDTGVPANRGHEAMAYLTYIIKNYDDLPDVSMFLHAHRHAWHNNELMDSDAVAMIERLNTSFVVERGYMNLRCALDHGCPAHLLPTQKLPFDENRPEQHFVAYAWKQIFPDVPLPEALSQPCCAQFAVSRETILKTPKARYEEIRQWLIDSSIADSITGRIFEYLWQYIFLGEFEHCPNEEVCYCQGYSLCFERFYHDGTQMTGKQQIQDYSRMVVELSDNQKELSELSELWAVVNTKEAMTRMQERQASLTSRIMWLMERMEERRTRARALGADPAFAKELRTR